MALGGINRATAYKLNAAGKLRFVKVAGRTFIPDDEVDRVAREGTEPSTQP
jgi:predicted site-specific integrase-resolvase